jgi:hypothetical protein
VKKQFLFIGIALLVILAPMSVRAQQGPTSDVASDVTPLSNKDVLLMVEKRISQDDMILAINSSPCVFDTFPPVLDDLKRRGVPEAVLKAMLNAPYGPSAKAQHEDLDEHAIYHYAEQLRQRNILSPLTGVRGSDNTSRRAARTRASRITTRRRA